MDLPLGRIRIREQGSAGGHNGLKSTIQHLRTQEFCRLRIGIGSPSLIPDIRRRMTNEHVLGRFNQDEEKVIKNIIPDVITGIGLLSNDGFSKASNYLNAYKAKMISNKNE